MNNLSKNLKTLLRNSKLSERELARRTNVPQQVINRIITGKNTNPKLETLLPLASHFMISISQLIGDTNLPDETKISSEYSGWTSIPFIDLTKLSPFSFLEITFPKKDMINVDAEVSQDAFAIKMFDDSMEPKFPNGSLLVFDRKNQIKNGQFCLIGSLSKQEKHKNFQFTVRQVLIKNRNTLVKCLNPRYSSFKSQPLNSTDEILGILVQAKIDY